MVFESIVVDLLNRYVGEYVENLDSKQLKIGIWGGDVVLENLVMKQSALDDLNLPVKTVHGHLGKLILKIPWKNLYSSPTEATVEKLFLLVVPNQDIRYDPEKEEKWKQEAKQAEIEKVEAAKKKELEKDKPKADDTFTEKMITQIVRNVQICIKDIHIRYEDRVTCPKSPFSFGITLHNLSVTTTNENWIPAISQDVTAKIFKHLTIDGLAIYWNSNCELFSLLESQGMNKRFKAGIPSKGQLVIGYKYMVGPISCTAKLQLNTKPELDLFQEPKALFNIEMEKVQLKISKLQYRDVFALVDSLDRMRRAALYRKYRPQVNTYRGHYKLWWKYAYTCILEEEVRRRRRNWDWVHIFTHRATCRKYAEAYQAKLLASSKESLETCRDCEIALDAFNIVLIRQKIEVEVERQGKLLEAKKKSEKAKGWFSGWWGKESSETAIEEQSKTDDIKKQFAEAMSGEEKEKLFRAIGYQENFVPDDLPVEFVAVRLNFLLQCLEVEVRDDDLEDEKSVMRVILNQMELQLEQRPSANAIRVSSMMYNLSATGLKQVDGLPEVCSSLHSIEGDGKTPLVKIIFETNPLCGTCDHRVHAEFKPLQVVYDAQTIIKLTDIFTPQEDQSAVVSQLQAAYQMKMAEMKEKSALGLQYTIQKHTRLDLKIDVMASHVIIPHGGFYNKKQPILVYNLGKFSVSSRLRQEDPLNVRNMHKEGYSEDKILDILRAESYDHFILKMEAAQVLLAYPDEDWLPLCCNHKQSDLHLLNPTDLTIEIHKCLIADDPRLPKVKIKGSLPQITLRIKEKRMVDTLVLLMSIPFTEAKYSKSYDQDQGFQLYLSTLSITPHDMNRLKKQKTVNMQLEDEEIIQYTDVEANFELQQIFIEVIAERGALSYSPTVSMSVLKLEAALLVQTFQISGEARLGGLELLHNFESKVIKVIDTPMASGKNEDLLILNYLSADKESPEFHSRYGSILQLLTVHFSKLNVLVHQEALMFLVHWIGKTQSYIEEQASALGKKKQDERPNTLTVRKESHFQASLTNLQESMREIWHPSSIKVGAAKKVKGKRVEVIDLKLDAKLDEIGITLSNNMHDLSRLEVSGCNSSIIMKKSYTQIDAKLTNFQVFDFNMNTAYPKVLKIVGKEELMTAQLVLFNEELLQRTTDAVNMSVKADIGCVRIVFINRFLTSVIGFMNNFQTAQEKLREASAAAAEAARTNVRQAYSAAVKIRLSITLKAPIIVIPENSKSSKALFFDLGFLTISNNFQDIVTKQDGHTAVIDHISLNLVNLKVSRVLLDDEGAIKTEQNILKPITFDLSVHRNLSCGWYTDVPDLDVGARLGTILIQLTNNDYVTLMSIVSENLAEVDSSYTKPDSFVCKDPSITAVAISKSSTSSKALSHGLGKGSVKLPQSDITTSIKFNFRLESIIVELFSDNEETDASNRRNSLRSQSLARMTLHLLSLKGVMLSDGTIASSVLMLNLLLDDTRASKASKINRYMERVSQDIDSNLSDDLVESQFPDPEDNNSVTPSNRRAMVDATIRLKDGNLYLDLRVYSFVLILNLEHLLKIRDLFVVPEKPELMDAAKKNSAKIVTSSVSYVTKPQAQAELQIPKDNEIMRNIDIHLEKPDIILVENLDDVNTNALNLQMEMNAKLSMSGSGKHQSISANIMDLQLFTCCYNPEKRQNTKSLVLFPFCVSLVGTTPEDNGLHLDLSTTKIHLSVSPGTIELLNKCYQTLYDEGMDNKSNRKDTDYSNVWSVSRVYEKDFWFLNSEVAQDALEVLTIESSVEVFAPLDEVCSVCVPSLVITLETGSGKHTIPCLLLESTASGKVHNWSSDLSLNMEITLQMNYYNCSLALWEPILEPIESFEEGNRVLDPWKLNMVMKKSIAEDQQSKEAMEAKPPTITINIQSLEAMELTITKTCLEVLTSIGASFQEAIYKPETTDKSEIEAPYKVQNDTGMSITVVLTDDSFKVSGVENTDSIREVVLKPDASVPLSALDLTTNEDYNRRSTFQDKRSPSFQTSIVNRLSVRSIEERYLNLKIEELNGAEVQIPVMKVDKRYFTLHRINSPDTSSKVYMEQIGLVVDITLESNATMKVTLCSIIRLYNNFSVAISVYFMTKKGNEVQLIASIPPKSHFNLPVQAIYTPTKEIFFSVDGYSLSTHPFIWKEVQSNWTFSKLLQCNSKNSEDKEPFFIKAVGEVEQVFFEFGNRHTMNSNCININLNPPVVLKNLLPIDIICCVQGIVTENTIKSGDVFEIPTCEPGSSSIVLRISGYLDREWSCKNSVAEEPPELDVWIFECYESPQRICFELGMHSVIKNGCLVMQLYCPFWMINKTALSLCYRGCFEYGANICKSSCTYLCGFCCLRNAKRSGKPTTETVNTGIPTEQPDDMSNVLFHPDDFKGPVMFSFRAKNFFGKKKATIKVENGEWSEKFSLDVVGSYGVVSCVTNSIKYQIGVNIQLMSNSLTKQVILTPYNVLVNNSPQTTLEYKENIKGGEWNSISPLSCCPFYPKSAGGSQLIVRVAKTSQETLSFPYDTIHNSLLKLDNEFGGVSVDVQITEGSVHITFDDFGPELATALIVNNTDFEIVLKEKNIEHETITLPPNHKTLFCWSTFNEDRFITWNEKYKTDLLKSDVGEFNVASNVTAYFASFLDGRQKILLFTMDATIVQTVQNAGQIEQFDSEIILSIHGIGLSLVDNIKLNEILYLGITSSVSWESLKSNKKQFKALPEAQNELLEEEYQLYLQRKRQGGNVPSVVSVGDKMIDFESFMVKKPHEKVLNRAYRTGFWVSYKQSKRQVQLHSKINRLQIDNQMQDCIFPVVLAPVPPPKSVAQHHAIKPFVEVSVVECLTERSAIKQFKYFKVLMQEFHVKVDVGFINSIVSFLEAGDISDAEEMKRFKNDCKSIDEELMSRVELISSREQKNYYDFFHFSPIKMHVSFSLSGGIGGSGGGGVHGSLPPIVSLLTQSLGVTLTDMHDVVFKLSYFERQYIFINQRQIMYEIQTHYIGQLIKQFYVLVFGLDVLGNPYGLVVGLKHGVEDLFYEPFQIKMGKKKKVTDSEKEKIRKIKRECERKRRQRLKEDPLLYQEHLQKEKERYKARVENGKIKKVSQMNEREKRAQRKKVKEKVRKHREKKKRENEINQMLNNNTPPGSDSDEAIPVLPIANNVPPAVDNILIVGRVGTSRKESGKRLAKKNKSKCYRELEKLKEKLKESNKRGDKYKKKLFRLKKKIANKNSPNTKTQQFLRGEKVSPRVRKQLQFSNALSCQIQENFKTNQHSRKSLKAFSLVLSGKIVKKYKAITQMKDYVGSYYKKMNKVVGKGNIHETLKTLTNYKTKNIKIKLDVVKFFEQDNVSRLEPGKKDCITRLKVKKQKRILTGSLSSLHKKFEVEYGYNIPYSEFCSFRPFWVLKANMKYRKTCLCEKHDNIELIIKKLKDLKVIDAIDSDGLVKALCCLPAVGERTKENCIERKCEECRDKQIKINTFENKEIEIEQWKREKKKIDIRGKEKLVMRVVKEVLNKTIKDVVKMLLDMIPIFMSHTANIVHQYRTIFELKQNLQENDILLHIDFSENYICKYGQEIQSVHFGGSHQQITLHTGVAYVKTQHDQPIQVISFCSLSESLKHDAPAITAHLQKILNYLKEKMGGINNLHFLSDSPSTQYRNRNMFFFMKEVLRKFCSKDFTWNYSESGHGKGAPDGIGGTLKRTADRLVAEGKDLASFQSLFSALEENTNIDLFSVSLGDIENFEKILKPGIKSFVGTMKCHQITLGEHATELNIRRLSCFNCSAEAKCSHFHLGLYNAGPSERDNSASLKNRVLHEDVYSSSSGEEIEDEKTKEKIVIGLYNAGPSERDKSPSLKKRVLYEDVYSSSSGEETEDKKTKEKIVIAIGDWVVVIYDDIWYPGIVEKRNGPNVEINFMHWNKGGKTFYWPSAADVQNVAIENILCRIKKHPHPISSRQFALNDDEFKRIENNFNNLTL